MHETNGKACYHKTNRITILRSINEVMQVESEKMSNAICIVKLNGCVHDRQ